MIHEDLPGETPSTDTASVMTPDLLGEERTKAGRLNHVIYWFCRHWLLVLLLVWGLFNLIPWLAPVFMRIGWTGPAQAIYLSYTFLCHQLPQRSFFLFGQQPMYDLEQIQGVWQNTDNPLILRQFTGNATMGWKVAWSDRMVSLYTGMLLWLALLGLWRRRLPRLPLWGLALLAVPMLLDGVTHMAGDMLSGVGAGFRYDNGWLATLTDNVFEPAFYVGNSLGSFNSWARLITGLLFGLGLIWFMLPILDASFAGTARDLRVKLSRSDPSL